MKKLPSARAFCHPRGTNEVINPGCVNPHTVTQWDFAAAVVCAAVAEDVAVGPDHMRPGAGP